MRYIEIIHHYDRTENDDCNGDYRKVTVTIDGTEVASYGDYYHEKGHLCAQAFADGAILTFGLNGDTTSLTIKRVADY